MSETEGRAWGGDHGGDDDDDSSSTFPLTKSRQQHDTCARVVTNLRLEGAVERGEHRTVDFDALHDHSLVLRLHFLVQLRNCLLLLRQRQVSCLLRDQALVASCLGCGKVLLPALFCFEGAHGRGGAGKRQRREKER